MKVQRFGIFLSLSILLTNLLQAKEYSYDALRYNGAKACNTAFSSELSKD